MRVMSTPADTKELSLTIYNGGHGAIHEKRFIKLAGNGEEIVYEGVAVLIETDSLLVGGLDIIEFNFDYDLVGKYKLLLPTTLKNDQTKQISILNGSGLPSKNTMKCLLTRTSQTLS